MLGQPSSSRARRSPDVVKGEIVKASGGLACLVLLGLLACAFWAGAMLASHPLLH
jgi:hypothetical protein